MGWQETDVMGELMAGDVTGTGTCMGDEPGWPAVSVT